MTRERRKQFLSLLYILLSVGVIAVIGVLDPHLGGLADALRSLDPLWLGAAVGCALLFWLTDGWLLHDITCYMYPGRVPFLRSLKVGVIGLYYGALTPFASGGQPFQVLHMHRDGMPTGTATGIICMKFAVYELSMCFLYGAAMLIGGAQFHADFPRIFWLTALGAAVNLFAVVLMAFALFRHGLLLRMGSSVIGLLSRMHILRRPEKSLEAFTRTIGEYREAAAYIRSHKLRCFGSFWISVLNLLCLYSTAYLAYRALGFGGSSWLGMMTMQLFHFLAVSFFPTPGASGATEGGFYVYFRGLVPADMLFVVMLLWRFLTYYMVLAAGCILVVWDSVRGMIGQKKAP